MYRSKSAQKNSKESGFTLLELLIVISIIGILAGVMAMVLDPNYYLADSRNARRRVDIHGIALALSQYSIDHNGYPSTVTTTQTEICADDAADCTGLIDLSVLTNNMDYLTSIPKDPKVETPNGTGYDVYTNGNGRITVVAALAEKGEVIEAIR